LAKKRGKSAVCNYLLIKSKKSYVVDILIDRRFYRAKYPPPQG
jgi:hypothetical protein